MNLQVGRLYWVQLGSSGAVQSHVTSPSAGGLALTSTGGTSGGFLQCPLLTPPTYPGLVLTGASGFRSSRKAKANLQCISSLCFCHICYCLTGKNQVQWLSVPGVSARGILEEHGNREAWTFNWDRNAVNAPQRNRPRCNILTTWDSVSPAVLVRVGWRNRTNRMYLYLSLSVWRESARDTSI